MAELTVPSFNKVTFSGEVRYKHLRNIEIDFEFFENFVSNQGGVTVAFRHVTPEELESIIGSKLEIAAIVVGFAGCSLDDNYDRKRGREIAEQRLETSNVLIVGDDYIERLLRASTPWEVADVIGGPLYAQGIRIESCA